MKRGEIWTVAAPGDYLSKPRPAVIVQGDGYADTDSVTICILTSDPSDAPFFRPGIEPSSVNGLQILSRAMVDKVTTVRRERLGQKLGQLRREEMAAISRAIATFLGLADDLGQPE